MRSILLCAIVAIGLGSCFQHLAVTCTPLHSKRFAEAGPEPRAEDLEEYRLNDEVWPSHYDIEIKPYFEREQEKEAFTFDGSNTITVTALVADVRRIKLHMARLEIVSWSVMRKSNSMPVGKVNETYNEVTQMLTLNLKEPLRQKEEYYVTFNYVGRMDEDMGGFYRSYFKVNGTKVWLGSTQFEQTEARRAFPCFDEPRYKTTFALKLNYKPAEYNVYSNTPVVRNDTIGNDRSLVTFGITPKMSTYLLAFIVAPYELTGTDVMEVLARPEALNQTSYSVQEGLKLLKTLGNWVDYPFDSVKEISRMYMAAVPDFAAGAMENWGLITYRESSLLYVPEDATTLQQQRIATIISHELAHQWFGNLVTCEWWDVTWLNEGFATYFEYFGTALVEPLWELDHQFVVEKLQTALQADGSLSTHPMTHTVYTQAQAAAMFDSISYNKGGVVLRMMEHYLTGELFQSAIRAYVKDRQFQSARPEQLFVMFDERNANASAFMAPWTTQPGYPLVTVSSTEGGVSIAQKRFLANGTDAEEKLLWPLPITFATQGSEFENTKPIIVANETFTIALSNVSDAKYFVLNNQQVGYYRVNYDDALWEKISAALQSRGFGGIHVLNRAQIVDDLLNLARADVLKYSKVLDMLSYLKQEMEYAPWLAAVNGFSNLALRIHPDDEELFKLYLLNIFSDVYEYVKFQAPTQLDRRLHTYLRRVVLDWTCRYGHDGCSKSALKEFERFRTNPGVKVHPDLRQVVYCEGIRKGSNEQFDFLLKHFLTTNVATEQQLTLQGMSCASEEATVWKFMDLTSSADVRSQDKATALSLLLSNQRALAHGASYLVQNSARWAEAHGGYTHVAMALGGILARVKDATVRTTVEQFAEANKDVLGQEAYELIGKGLLEFDHNQQFTMNHRDEIRGFLSQKAGNGASETVIYNAVVVLCVTLVTLFWVMTMAEKLALVALVTCACALVSQASPLDPERYFLVEAEPRAQLEDYRLNDDVWPSHYDIEIKPYLEAEGNKAQFTFDGSAKITVTTQKQNVMQIKLHMARMDISAWSVTRKSDNTVIPTQQQMYDEETHILTLPLSSALQANVEYVLSFTYVGNMDDDMHGFYRSYYWENGVKVWMGSTQFQQTHARLVLRMMEHYLTTETFKTALRAYIKDRAFKTTRPDDLFNAFNRYDPNAKSYMEPWTVQPGYPLVTVTAHDSGFTITQKRFLVNEPDHTEQTAWPLPISYATKASEFANTRPTFYTGMSFDLPMQGATDVQFFILNNQQVGYYRVNYDAILWGKISKALRSEGFGGIHVLNRAQIVDDLFNLARGDVVPYGTALEILEYLKDETEYAPWLAAVNGLTTLARRIHVDDEKLFAAHILDIFSKAYDIVKFQAPSSNERRVFTYMRQNVLQWACNYGHEECSKAAVAEFERYHKNPSVKVHPDLRQVVYCEGIRKGSMEEFEFLWNQYLTTNMATEQILILQGLGCASTSELITIMLNAIASPHVRSQDKNNAFTYVINNAYTLPHVSRYLQQNHAIWADAFGSYSNVASAFNNILARLKSDSERDTISAFIESNKNTLGQAAYDSIMKGLEDYESNKQFTLRNRDEISEFLDNKINGGAATMLANVSMIVGLMTMAEKLALVALVTCACALVSQASPLDPERYFLVEAEPRAQLEDYRLNDDVWPSHYDIEIKPYLEAEGNKAQFTFDGSAKITVTTQKQNVMQIKLHMARMDISAWSVTRKSDNTVIPTQQQMYDEETHILTLPLSSALQANVEYVLSFTYIMLDAIASPHVRSQDKSNAFTYVINNAYTLPHVSRYLQQHHAIWATAHGSYMDVAAAFNNVLTRLKSDSERDAISAFIESNKNTLGQAAYDSIKKGLEDYESNKQFTLRNRDEISEFLDNKINGGAATMLANVSMIVGLLMLVMARW
uniref:Aminopeptidase N n=1 Tax=Anopheles epiroticus TaxID=199890 RepID=A0A182PTS9_9DIPT